MDNQLVERDGWLFILSEATTQDRPQRTRAWYPLDVKSYDLKRNYGDDRIGQILRYLGDGLYQDSYGLKYRLKDGGKTVSQYFETETINPPAAHKNVELRWYQGTWQKYLKRQGWVCA